MGQNSSQCSKMTQVSVIVVGAGCRGDNYSNYATIHPDRTKVVGVADPRKFARTKLQQKHNIENENVFEDWESMAAREKFADAALICTPDRIHKDPAIAFAKKGYHILLEKPMATTPEDCRAIVEACIESEVILSVGHVLRYDPTIHKIKELIEEGAIGDVIHIQHLEPVGFYHFAHSFVRGNWRNEAESSFALLAKSCHDIDLIHHWAGARRCIKVSSFGSVSHFKKAHKPTGAGERCLDCPVEKDCSYSASKIYLDQVKQCRKKEEIENIYMNYLRYEWFNGNKSTLHTGHTGWPVSVICQNSYPDIESVTEALRSGPYGRCVYECDNDVCTNQVVNMEFEGGVTAAFSMVAFTEKICQRQTTIYGSKGELSYDANGVRVFDFLTRRSTKHNPSSDALNHFGMSGHGGADYHLMNAFISAVANNDPSLIRSGPKETLHSHLLVFEAERSRVQGRVVFCGDNDSGSRGDQIFAGRMDFNRIATKARQQHKKNGKATPSFDDASWVHLNGLKVGRSSVRTLVPSGTGVGTGTVLADLKTVREGDDSYGPNMSEMYFGARFWKDLYTSRGTLKSIL